MPGRIRARLSYANLTATVAAIAALGAGGYAIGAVPDRSGRINACYVASGKRQGEMRVLTQGTRCRPGERRLAWNQRGLPGSDGDPGAAGPQGPPGPSDAWNQGLFQGGPGLTLPAGSYWIVAGVQGDNGGGAAADLTCTLTMEGTRDVKTVTLAPGAKAELTLNNIHEVRGPANANVSCTGSPSWGGRIVAVRIGTVHEI